MGARGPHDDLGAAKEVIEAALSAMNRGEVPREHVDANIEHVSRDGVLHGPERLFSEFSTQTERWAIAYKLDDLVDADDGALIAHLTVERRNRESGDVEWRAWPALVLRIHGGKIVFLEGYVDRRKAILASSTSPPRSRHAARFPAAASSERN